MKNKEIYRFTNGLVNEIDKFLNGWHTFSDIDMALQDYKRFCSSHDCCDQCPLCEYEIDEKCFVQWLDMEVKK